MKMKYEKPMVAVDLYQLTQSIAGCSIKVNYVNSGCFMDSPNTTVDMKALASVGFFVDGACLLTAVAGTTYDGAENGVCYHTNVNGALLS
jgi:hypothetical protein